MSELSNRFFRDLPPRDRRYDVPVEDELVFCVFPNGVKTWVHVYPFEGFTRRRTIGLYPDMRFEQVREALEQSRQIMEVDTIRERRRASDRLRGRGARKILVPMVAAAAGVAVSVLLATSRQPPEEAADPATPTAVSQPIERLPEPTPERPPEPVGEQISPAERPIKQGSKTDLLEPPPRITRIQLPVEERLPDVAVGPEGNEERSLTAEDDDDLSPVPADDVASGETESRTGTGPASFGSVSRAILTEAVVAHEPVNRINGPVEMGPGSPDKVFFFTELRDFGGQRVLHRWRYGDQVMAEVGFDVGANDRWRVYSSKTVGPDQAGEWSVEVVARNGLTLATTHFVVLPKPQQESAVESAGANMAGDIFSSR